MGIYQLLTIQLIAIFLIIVITIRIGICIRTNANCLFSKIIKKLLSDENFLAVVTTRSSNKKENLIKRLTLAVDAFADLE